MAREQLHYGATAKAFHWGIAALLAVQFPLGWLMPDIRRGMMPGTAMLLHLSLGMTILVLLVLRFLWRLTHPVAPESGLPAWQRVSSEAVHWLLYVAVLVTTTSGWIFASYRGWTVFLWGLVPLPRLAAEGAAAGRSLGGLHGTVIWVLLGLVAAHVGAALVHLFVYRDGVMRRMLPAGLPREVDSAARAGRGAPSA